MFTVNLQRVKILYNILIKNKARIWGVIYNISSCIGVTAADLKHVSVNPFQQILCSLHLNNNDWGTMALCRVTFWMLTVKPVEKFEMCFMTRN